MDLSQLKAGHRRRCASASSLRSIAYAGNLRLTSGKEAIPKRYQPLDLGGVITYPFASGNVFRMHSNQE